MNIIETNRLFRRFGKTEAVNDLTFTVPTGSVFALLGPNGAGKTTTIKLIMNLLRPTAGEARIMGVDSRKLGPRELARIGYVSENQQMPQWMTVRQLITYCRPFYPTWDSALEKNLLVQFELPENRALKDLSRGMQMKAAFLCALAYRPKLLVLDEPFSGLDPLVRDEVSRGILEISDLGNWSVFVSSHDIEEVERLADHICLIDQGRVRLSEPTECLQARFRRIDLALRNNPAAERTMPPTWLQVERSGGRVSFIESQFSTGTEAACREYYPDATVTVHPMTLREIFITLARSIRKEPKGAAA